MFTVLQEIDQVAAEAQKIISENPPDPEGNAHTHKDIIVSNKTLVVVWWLAEYFHMKLPQNAIGSDKYTAGPNVCQVGNTSWNRRWIGIADRRRYIELPTQ